MHRVVSLLALLIPLVGGCARPSVRPAAAVIETVVEPDWMTIASAEDRGRIAALPNRWMATRTAVPQRLRRAVEREGPLVDPAAALDMPALPPGPYRCRLLRFGGRAGYASFAPDFCYVETDGTNLSFTKQTGSNLPSGWLHADTPTRQVFLGTVRSAGEVPSPGYGKAGADDIAGVVERVAPFRWRLVLTRAGRGALLDLYELVPVTPEVPGATPAVPAG